ncbi:FlxA-like family protein [Citrobacter sp. Cy232]|uniref:FlxA-like family protein n=1 Tax=unclassified Citrobacter TaxID=2644389 RepID=UPI001902C9BC|nr:MULTISPECIES: FlxA-like family protein [unclassified Citrobacter]MBJ9882812.1 FlxA-like family protein [Citrobacter sp. FDAARGOS_156]MDM2718289.1 FlxA-like family protein [Citrobacter sp. Cy232]
MTTINVSTPTVQSSSGGKAPAGNDISAQIAQITQKITKLTQQLKDIPNISGTIEQKREQQELIQTQIKMLQAQLDQLLRRQAEESQQKQSADQRKAEGINTASDQHQVDIYI